MKELILRNTPDIADRFELRDIESADSKNTYEVFCENEKIVICGDCKISQAMGYYAYLKKYCGVNISVCGNREISVSEAPLFEGKLSKVIPQGKRFFLNYSTFGNSLAFWQWDKWEKLIDLMAMNGINMPLALVGSEAVWYYTMRDFKYSETGALSYISGPAFWYRQLLSNIAAYFPLTDVKYIESRLELGKKIIERETELGMTPVLQGFSGLVPQSITKLFKGLRLQIMPSWNNFPFTYRLDPGHPVFRKFGTALLNKQRQLFGSYHYFLCDPFYDCEPMVKRKDYLWKVGRAMDTLYKDFDPESVWVMQSGSVREKLVKAVPKERLLILDTDGTGCASTENFWGYNYIAGITTNCGDRSVLHGNIKALAENPWLDAPENCTGTGIFSEGINQNPMYFDFALQMLTEDGKVDPEEWYADYAFRRYGSDEECLAKAVKILGETCYAQDGRENGSVICARPGTHIRHAAPGDTLEPGYDNAKLFEAAELLLSAEKAEKSGYTYDVCDVTRQALSNCAGEFYINAQDGFDRRDLNLFERSSNGFLRLCEELDELLQTMPEFSLHTYLKEAGAVGLTDKDKQNFELNLLTQVTVWGPVGNPIIYDYAWKEWGGLVKTYYAKRWQSFFELLAYRFPRRGKFSTSTRKQFNDRNAYVGNGFYKNYAEFERKWLSTADPEAPTEDSTVEIARRLVEKYTEK